MRALDADEREAMAIAVRPADSVCPCCGEPTTSEREGFPPRLRPALFRCVRRRLVRLAHCSNLDVHIDATALGRTIFHITTGAEVTP